MVTNITEQKQMSTGTTTVVLMCKNGIVMAADKRATAGNLIADKKIEKIHQIMNETATTIAGSVSDVQLILKIARAELILKQLKSNTEVSVKEISSYMAGLNYQGLRAPTMIPSIAHFLVAGKDKSGFSSYNVDVDGSITSIDDYYTSGSGSVFVFGILDTYYNKNMSIDEGIKLATKCINAALQRDTASGEGIDVAVIDDKGFKKVKRELVNIKFSE